ncbi:ZNF470 [Symbiodinium natans]|uniref:ZNF470 protein n=1 Tax=Symbiodinium natans TaxID=878477 RepID=A0A812LQY9_9DINO|nr:ZNF470 [Symbiodinium natans]
MQSTAVDRDWKVQAGDDLAKNLGESCLLADLGPLLRMKQEKAVQDAVAARSGSSNASNASGSDAQQTSTAYANRIGSQESLPSLCTPTPRDSQVTSRRQMPYRCIRLNICLVLERICSSIPPGGPALFEVPVSQIYEMLQASCSRAGACSFAFGKPSDEAGEAEEEVAWPQVCSAVSVELTAAVQTTLAAPVELVLASSSKQVSVAQHHALRTVLISKVSAA